MWSSIWGRLSANGWMLLAGLSLPGGFSEDSCKRATEALQRRELPAAERLFRDCMAAAPVRIEHLLALCGIFQAQNREMELVRTAEEGLKCFPGEPRFYQVVGNHAGRTALYERAVEIFGEAHRRWPATRDFQQKLASAHLMLGTRLMDESRNQEAEHHLRAAVRLSDRDVDAHLNLGRVLHMQNQSVEALAEFDRVVALDAEAPLIHFHRGLVLNSMGEFDDAAASLTQEIEATPDYPPSYLLRGEVLMKQGDYAAALPDLTVAVREMPDHPTAAYMRGRCLQHLGRNEEAENELRRAVVLDPDNPEPMNTLARLLWLTDRQEEATALSQKARTLTEAARTGKQEKQEADQPKPTTPND